MKERKIVDYTTIIESIPVDSFDRGVNNKIREGWQPIGNVAAVLRSNKVYYIQTLVKYEETEEEL